MTILVGENDEFNNSLADALDAKLVPVETTFFRNREVCPKAMIEKDELKYDNSIILSLRKTPEEDPNAYCLKFLLLGDEIGAAVDKKKTKVIGVMPYLSFARADKHFLEGKGAFEPVSVKHLLKHLGTYGLSDLVTFNAHFEREEKIIRSYHPMVLHNLDAFKKVLNEELKSIEDLFIIAPDEGMKCFAEKKARELNCGFDYLEKNRERTGDRKSSFVDKKFDVEGKVVVVPDDMISSGGTLIEGGKIILKSNPKALYAMAVHGEFVNNAYDRLKEVYNNVLFTNTLKHGGATTDIIGYLSNYIQEEFLTIKWNLHA